MYGETVTVPMHEDLPTSATNPYGWTKVMQERILTDAAAADPHLRVALLRYFNPVGAHASGTIGEDPRDIPNNLMPYISQVAVGRRERLQILGDDYDTPDGTPLRDYIHVEDLAAGHVAALDHLRDHPQVSVRSWNLGTGHGSSVMEMVRAFEAASGRQVPFEVVSRRSGDLAIWRRVMPTSVARRPSSGGARAGPSSRCALTLGDGSQPIRWDTTQRTSSN